MKVLRVITSNATSVRLQEVPAGKQKRFGRMFSFAHNRLLSGPDSSCGDLGDVLNLRLETKSRTTLRDLDEGRPRQSGFPNPLGSATFCPYLTIGLALVCYVPLSLFPLQSCIKTPRLSLLKIQRDNERHLLFRYSTEIHHKNNKNKVIGSGIHSLTRKEAFGQKSGRWVR
jgi:hypothetical protein